MYFCFRFIPEWVSAWPQLALFFVTLISTAAFGYLLNDFCDIKSDNIAGKANSLQQIAPWFRVAIVLLPLVIASVSWALLHFRLCATVLFLMQLLSLIAYSVPPLRFKERSWLGVVTDAFYGHINPVFITLTAFMSFHIFNPKYALALTGLIFFCTALKGIRNILLHQIDDRKKDARAHVNTFVVKNGSLLSFNLVNRLLGFEVFILVLLIGLLSLFFPPFLLSILVFAVITYLKFSGWKLSYLPKRQLRFKFRHFLNDYFEGWMPLFFLLLLTTRNHQLFWLLPLHLILFPSFIIKLWNDLRTIRQNFKTEHDY